jgi:DNA-binding CsgD family transcriptional regulator/PAS domain-containing protein
MEDGGVGAVHHQTFDHIVADFYRAATGELSWTQALEGVQREFGARAAVIHPYDAHDGRLLGLHAGGPALAPALFDYISQYHLLDPRKQLALQRGAAAIGQWTHCHEHFDEAFVAQDPFFQNYLVAYDTRYNSNVTLPVNRDLLAGFIVELPAARGVLTPDEREVIRRLGTHLLDALRAYQRVRSLMSQALAGHTLLQSYPYPMWLMDEQRHISFANPAAQGEVLRAERAGVRGERLILVNNRADQRLTECLHLLTRQGHGATAVVDLRNTQADAPLWLHLSLLVPDATLGAFGLQPQVLATLFDPQHISALDTFALAQMFNLTPTEAKVAARLAEGLTAEQIGQLHGTTEGTVRSQIRQVLSKLGALRLADVVRMLRQGEALWAAQATELNSPC